MNAFPDTYEEIEELYGCWASAIHGIDIVLKEKRSYRLIGVEVKCRLSICYNYPKYKRKIKLLWLPYIYAAAH